MIGDGSYLMLNSEIATSVMLGLKLTIVLLDNRGYGCINRLQMATGGANFNNLLKDSRHEILPDIDFAAHAASLGAIARKCRRSPGWKTRCKRPRQTTAPPCWSSTPIRWFPPMPAAIGGMWRCRKCRRGRRSTRRAKPMTRSGRCRPSAIDASPLLPALCEVERRTEVAARRRIARRARRQPAKEWMI